MDSNVKCFFEARLDRLVKESFNLNNLTAYAYRAMEEYGVNTNNEQAVRALRAMQEIWVKSEEIRAKAFEDILQAFEEATGDWKSIRKVSRDAFMEVDNWDLEAYRHQKMEEHGVDTEDEQAIRAINAMSDIWNKKTDMEESTRERIVNALELHTRLQKKGNEPAEPA